uniref:Putative transcription factor adf-1-like protein n=1 Tax=Nyssomyia neivai TaxID=330878 RepID=A0A1L8DFJ4_9DIPT
MISSKDKEVLLDIQKRPVLYAKEFSTPSKDNITGKIEAWKELSVKHKYAEDKLRSRWNFLRKKFRTRLKASYGGDPPSDAFLEEFEPMRFLVNHIDWGRAERLKRKPATQYRVIQAHDDYYNPPELPRYQVKQEDVQVLSSDEEDQSSHSQYHNIIDYPQPAPEVSLHEYNTECPDSSGNNKDDELFLLSLMPFMTQLSGCQKLRARIRIQEILYEELQKNGVNNTSCSY